MDEICGSESIRYEHLQKFKYIDAALKEALRLKSTAPAWTVASKKDEVIGGCYKVEKGQPISIVLDALHRDPVVWGDDVEEFRPERMLDGKFEALPPDSWKPFGKSLGRRVHRSCTADDLNIGTTHRQWHARVYRPTVRLARILTCRRNGMPGFFHLAFRYAC